MSGWGSVGLEVLSDRVKHPPQWPHRRDKYISAFGLHVHSFPGGSVVKNLPANAGDTGSIPELGRSPGGGNGTPLQYSCLGNPTGRGTRRTTVCGVTKSQTWLKDSAATAIHFQSGTGRGLLLQVLVPRHPPPHPLGVKWMGLGVHKWSKRSSCFIHSTKSTYNPPDHSVLSAYTCHSTKHTVHCPRAFWVFHSLIWQVLHPVPSAFETTCAFRVLFLFFFCFFGCARFSLLHGLTSNCGEQGLLFTQSVVFSLRWLLLLKNMGSRVHRPQ